MMRIIVLISVITTALSSCPDYCGNYNVQVCGFNGEEKQIFQNVCKMHVMNCKMREMNKHIFNVLPQSECKRMIEDQQDKEPAVKGHICDKICTDRSSRSVCGEHANSIQFDRKLFKNQCEMAKINCKTGSNYMVTFSNMCSMEEEQVLSSTPVVERDRSHCDKLCSSDKKVAVCGSDGTEHRFFSNTCEMKVFNCKRANGVEAFHPVYSYKCFQSLCVKSCNDEDLDPICGFSGKFYAVFNNKCKMMMANCDLDAKDQYRHVPERLCGDRIWVNLNSTQNQIYNSSQIKTSTEVIPSPSTTGRTYTTTPSSTTIDNILSTTTEMPEESNDTSTNDLLKDETTTPSIDVDSTTMTILNAENPQEVCNRCSLLINTKRCPSVPNPSLVWCWLCRQAIKDC